MSIDPTVPSASMPISRREIRRFSPLVDARRDTKMPTASQIASWEMCRSVSDPAYV